MLELNEVKRLQDSAKCLYTANEVSNTVQTLAEKISVKIAETNPIVSCVMNGGLRFCADLLSHWQFPLELDYVHTSRYRGDTQSGQLIWQSLPKLSLVNRTVIIIDDIFDEGETLKTIVEAFQSQGAKQVFSAVLIEKVHQRQQTEIRPDFIGLTVDDQYVVGYGMDYQGYFRNLSGIFAL